MPVWWTVLSALLPQLAQWSWQCPFNTLVRLRWLRPTVPLTVARFTMVVMSALYLCDEPYWSRYHFNLHSPSVHVISDGKKENLSLKNFAFLCIICKYSNFWQKKFAESYNSFWSCSWFAKMFFVKVCENVKVFSLYKKRSSVSSPLDYHMFNYFLKLLSPPVKFLCSLYS
jgi:hypothetical protein